MLNPPVSLQLHLEYRSFLSLNYGETKTRGRRWFDQSLDDQDSIVLRINRQRGVYKQIIFQPSMLIATTLCVEKGLRYSRFSSVM